MKPAKKQPTSKAKDAAKPTVPVPKKEPPKPYDTHCPFFGAKLM